MSTQLNPAVLGSFLLGCLPFNFLLFKNKRLRLFGIIGSLISVSVIMLAASRGVFLGLIVSLSLYLWMRKKLILLCFFLAGVISLIAVSSCQRCPDLNRFGFSRFISGSYDSIISEYRINRVKMTARILKEHPFTGIGFGHFRARYDEFCDKGESGEIEEFRIPDNMYLTFLAETGLIGTLGFLIFMFFLLKNGLMRLVALKDRRKEELLIPLTALAGLLVNMGAYELFYWSNPYMLFCLICGFIQAAAAGAVKAEVASDKT
jgi:O-antigen ligase